MKLKNKLVILFLFCTVFAANSQHEYKISTKEVANISPMLYGNFIELGYGIQVEPMWAEMFFNRSFEKFAPYKVINKLWYDLYYDDSDLSKGYEHDWSKFDWYHSGYEHNAWFAAPGDGGNPSVIGDSSTFFINTTPLANVEITETEGGSGHGTQCLKLENKETEKWAAVAQSGKLFKAGETYNFRGMLKGIDKKTDAEIRIYPQGNWDKPIISIPINGIDTMFALHSAQIKNTYNGYVTFSLWVPSKTTILMDDFSLTPANTYYGWRKDVVDVFKALHPTVVRFPGGCFASFYDWKEGIGPYSERVPQDSYFWGGQNYNDVGTAEFAMLCKAAGSEMQICVNVFHPSKRKLEVDFSTWQAPHGRDFPKFMSLTEGAKAAADWVAYCNLPAGSHPMADLRAKHGYPEPFGVKYWELDNEVARWFEAEDYAWAAVVYSKAMKAVDPTIQIGLSSYGDRPRKPTYHDDILKMLEIAGLSVDFLADRADASDETRSMIAKVRQYNAAYNTDIKYCHTEWLAYNTDVNRDSYNLAKAENGITKSYAFSKWGYALNLLKNFMAFQRMGDEMLFVNVNNLANTHAQNVMETPKEKPFLSAPGVAMQLLGNSPAATVLKIEGYNPPMKDDFQVQVAWDKTKTKLILYVCNRTTENEKCTFDVSSLAEKFTKATYNTIEGKNAISMNSVENDSEIKIVSTTSKPPISKGKLTVNSKAYSFVEIILE
jgi:alpha-N-arabinofuranosidase